MRISKRTYELAQMGVQHAAWKLPTSAFGPSSWANVMRGGWYVTVITVPKGDARITLPSAMRSRDSSSGPGWGVRQLATRLPADDGDIKGLISHA